MVVENTAGGFFIDAKIVVHPDKLRYHKNEIQNIGRKKMEKLELIAPCHFGLEAVLKREIQDLGYEIINVEDGRVTFAGDASAICRANVFLRTAERVLLKV